MKWDRLRILNFKNCHFRESETDYQFSILERLLKNDKLRELDIAGLCVKVDKYEQFRETLRERKRWLKYSC